MKRGKIGATTFIIMTPRITDLIATLLHNSASLTAIMLSVIILNVIMLSVVALEKIFAFRVIFSEK